METYALWTNDDRAVGYIDVNERIAYKKVSQKSHQLRIPPAWTYDESIINQILLFNKDSNHDSVLKFVIDTTDTGRKYSISLQDFMLKAYKQAWRQNKNFFQYVCLLKYWTHNEFNQMKLF